MTAIDITGLDVTLEKRKILSDLSLSIAPGAFVGVVGPNGAGKSTLAKSLLRLLEPDEGTITIQGKRLTAYRRNELAKVLSYLPQDAPVHWSITVEEVVGLGRFAYGGLSYEATTNKAAIESALTATDTAALRTRSISRLSGGEYARVMLARALAATAPILIADEPIASLDPYHQLHVMEILKQYAEDGNTVLAILHDLTLAGRFCDRIVMMGNGKVVGDGAPQEILRGDLLQQTYGVQTIDGHHKGERFVIPWKRRNL